MALTLESLPADRLAPLMKAYEGEVRRKRVTTSMFMAGFVAAALASAWTTEVDLARLVDNIGRFFSYFGRIFVFDAGTPDHVGQLVLVAPLEWFWGWSKWLSLIADTLLIAYLGTALGAAGGFALCFLAVRNLTPNPILRGTVKRFLEFSRTVPEIVFALIFVIAFGLGPIPGVLAIAIHTMGALGKLFSEVVENIDMNPVEGVTASGGSWTQVVRFAVVPQVLSNFVSYALLRFEINVRGAAVMGFVGAGGIGQDLIEAIRKFYYTDVSAILLLIIVTVMLIDIGTERLRHALIGMEQDR